MSLMKVLGRVRGFIYLIFIDTLIVIVAFGTPSWAPVSISIISEQEVVNIIGVLLAITFASYSLLFNVIPYLRKSILESVALEYLGTLFLITIYLEMFTLGLGIIVQVRKTPIEANTFLDGIYSLFFLASLSSIALLSYYLHLLFKHTKNQQS